MDNAKEQGDTSTRTPSGSRYTASDYALFAFVGLAIASICGFALTKLVVGLGLLITVLTVIGLPLAAVAAVPWCGWWIWKKIKGKN